MRLFTILFKLITRVLPIKYGGTGATTAEGARDKLGIHYTGVACSAKGSAATLALPASTIKAVTLDTWIARTDTAFAFSGGGIKCPYTGIIEVSGSVYINGFSTGATGCYIKRGTEEITSQYLMGYASVASGKAIVPVTAGDIVYLNARCSVAANCVPNNNATHLDVKYIK